MQKEHREAIQRNFSSLVEQTDLDLMVAALYEKRVFSDAMIEPYKNTSRDTRTRKQQLYRDIMRRGPHAFQHLLDALSENGYWGLVRDLDPESPLHPRTVPNTTGENNFLSLSDKRKNMTGNQNSDSNGNRSSHSPRDVPLDIRPGPPSGNGTELPLPDAAVGGHPVPHFNVVKSTKFFEENEQLGIRLYRTRSRRRGVLVLFSYTSFRGTDSPRRGAQADHANLKYLFDELDFEVLSYLDLSLQETQNALRELRRPGSLLAARPDCVFVVFASHGYRQARSCDTEIRCADGQLLPLLTIVKYFSNAEFPALNGIPKVFIFQTCRGEQDTSSLPPPPLQPPQPRRAPRSTHSHSRGGAGPGRGPTVYTDGTARQPPSPPPARGDDPAADRLFSDILIAHSTVPGYVSHRDPEAGSWYIQALCLIFAARAHDCHVDQLFTLVDDHMEKVFHTQTSSVDRWGFNRSLYLHPGLYEDGD